MNTPIRRHAALSPAHRATRLLSAALGCIVGVGVMAAVASGMVQQSGGHSLGDFVASHLAAEQPLLAVAPAAQSAG